MPDPDSTSTVTERIVFTGRVQAVGFRFSTRSLAQRHPVKGFVRNLPDSSVELVVQGAPAAINGLLSEIANCFGDGISHIDRQPIKAFETFSSFAIRF